MVKITIDLDERSKNYLKDLLAQYKVFLSDDDDRISKIDEILSKLENNEDVEFNSETLKKDDDYDFASELGYIIRYLFLAGEDDLNGRGNTACIPKTLGLSYQ